VSINTLEVGHGFDYCYLDVLLSIGTLSLIHCILDISYEPFEQAAAGEGVAHL
jgi:hypothetical protein